MTCNHEQITCRRSESGSRESANKQTPRLERLKYWIYSTKSVVLPGIPYTVLWMNACTHEYHYMMTQHCPGFWVWKTFYVNFCMHMYTFGLASQGHFLCWPHMWKLADSATRRDGKASNHADAPKGLACCLTVNTADLYKLLPVKHTTWKRRVNDIISFFICFQSNIIVFGFLFVAECSDHIITHYMMRGMRDGRWY